MDVFIWFHHAHTFTAKYMYKNIAAAALLIFLLNTNFGRKECPE